MNTERLAAYCRSKKEHIVNFGSFFANRILSLGLFALTTSVFINHAGTTAFGHLTMLLLIFNYIAVADLGMGYAVGYRLTRAVSRGNTGYAEKILQHAIPFYLMAGCGAALLVFVFASAFSRLFTHTDDYALVYRVIALGIPPLVIDAIVLMVLQSYNRVYLINLSRLVYDVFRAAPLLLAVVCQNGLLEKIMVIMVAGCYIKLMMDINLCYRLTGPLNWMKPVLFYRELRFNVLYGFPMLLVLAIGLVISSIDKFYMMNFLPMEQLGYYSVAFEVNVKAWFLIWAVTGSLTTVLVRRNVLHISTQDIEKLSLISVGVIFALYYLPLIVFAEPILSLWINPDFAEKSYRLTRILAVASLFYMLYAVQHNTLQAKGHFLTIAGIYAAGLVVLLISLWVLPGYFQVEGVAGSYIVTYAAFFGLSVYIMKRKGRMTEPP